MASLASPANRGIETPGDRRACVRRLHETAAIWRAPIGTGTAPARRPREGLPSGAVPPFRRAVRPACHGRLDPSAQPAWRLPRQPPPACGGERRPLRRDHPVRPPRMTGRAWSSVRHAGMPGCIDVSGLSRRLLPIRPSWKVMVVVNMLKQGAPALISRFVRLPRPNK
jgi:hypothetical protein